MKHYKASLAESNHRNGAQMGGFGMGTGAVCTEEPQAKEGGERPNTLRHTGNLFGAQKYFREKEWSGE